jgi:D-3-phosphoglycerate dehydrogenase
VLGEAGVNIANFHLGRNKEASDAVAFLEVDQDIADSVLKKIEKLPSVKRVKLLEFDI